MNNRKEITERNRIYLKDYFKMEENDWLDFLRNVGPPLNVYGLNWSPNNPAQGWCGGVTMALRLSGKVPDGYIPCRHKSEAHFYMINPNSKKVIDLTIYQFEGEYKFDYTDYQERFMNVLSNSVSMLMDKLGLKIDSNKFYTVKKKQIFIKKVKQNIL